MIKESSEATATSAVIGQPDPIAPSVSDDGTARVPSFSVPFSAYASKEARDLYLYRARTPLPYFKLPKDATITDVRKVMDDEWYGPQLELAHRKYPVNVEIETIGGIRTQVVTPKEGIASRNAERILINVHGGGFNTGSMTNSLIESIPVSSIGRIKVISVDYRMAPEHKFPAGSEDLASVYREVLKTYEPALVAIFGCSAGGVLSGQAIPWFLKESLPIPAAIGIFCASTLWPFAGDSAYVTPRLGGLIPPPPISNSYFEGADPNDPLVSPSASVDILKMFPPTLLISGTRAGEMSAIARSALDLTRAGVDARLCLWDGMDHSFFKDVDLPESQEAFEIMVNFFTEQFERPRAHVH